MRRHRREREGGSVVHPSASVVDFREVVVLRSGRGAPELPRRFYGKCKSEGTGFWEVKAKHGILVSKGKAWDPGKYVGKYAKARHGILVSKHRAKHGMLESQEKQSIGFR